MTMFEMLRQDVSGVLASAQLEVRLRWIERHLEHGEYLGALRALLSLASFMTGLDVSATSWRAVLLEGVRCGLVSGESSLLEELVEHYFWLGWTGSARGGSEQPWSVLALCRELDDEVFLRAGVTLGAALMRQYPRSPIGPYLSSHYNEIELLSRRTRTGGSRDDGLGIAFQRVRQLAIQCEASPAFIEHVTLREGAQKLLYQKEIKEGRALLKGLDFDLLSVRGRLWYALAMTRSSYWLDRVRGLDALDALAAQVRGVGHSPGEVALDVPSIHHGLEWVLYQEMGVAQEAELDRLRGVVFELYPSASSEREAMLGLVELSGILSGDGSISLEDSGDLLERLWQKSQAMRDDGWTRHIMAARLMRAHLLAEPGRERLGTLAEDASGQKKGLATSVNHALSLLHACRHGSLEEVLSTIEAWLDDASDRAFSWSAQEVKPCFGVLPACLERLERETPKKPKKRELAAPDADQDELLRAFDDATARHEMLSNACTKLLEKLLSGATTAPSYGWWSLGAHLVQHQLFEVAGDVVKLAREQREEVDPAMEHYVMGSMLAWASARQHDPVTMMYWLEACSPHT